MNRHISWSSTTWSSCYCPPFWPNTPQMSDCVPIFATLRLEGKCMEYTVLLMTLKQPANLVKSSWGVKRLRWLNKYMLAPPNTCGWNWILITGNHSYAILKESIHKHQFIPGPKCIRWLLVGVRDLAALPCSYSMGSYLPAWPTQEFHDQLECTYTSPPMV